VHHEDEGGVGTEGCTVLLENHTTWAWLPLEKKCAKIFEGHGAPPRDWVNRTYYNYDGIVNVTDDYGKTTQAHRWCGCLERGEVDPLICFWENVETGLPLAHRYAVADAHNYELYYNVTVQEDLGPIERPSYCPAADTPPLYEESYMNFRYLCHFTEWANIVV